MSIRKLNFFEKLFYEIKTREKALKKVIKNTNILILACIKFFVQVPH